MHKQDFEKSVQQKLEELSFTPSASVWEGVKTEIRPQQRRRKALWLLPLLLLIGAGGWWIAQHNETKSMAANGVAIGESTTQPKGNTSNGSAANNVRQTEKEPDNTNSVTVGNKTPGQQSNAEARSFSKRSTGVAEKNKRENNGDVTAITAAAKDGDVLLHNNSVPTIKHTRTLLINEQTAQANIIDQADTFLRAAPRLVTAERLLQADSASHALLVNGQQQRTALAYSGKQNAAKKESTWQWGMSMQYGYADISNKNILGSNTGTSDFDNFNALPSPNFSNTAFRSPAPQTEKGRYVSGGITVQRKINHSLSLGTGLQYESFSQRQAVGHPIRRDSLPSNLNTAPLRGNVFYSNLSKESWYYNRVQQITVPLMLYVKPLTCVPVELTAGMHAGYIVGAKSLSYDPITFLYYPQKTGVNKLQVAAVAGLQYRLVQKGGWELMAGPQVQYHLSRLNKTGTNLQRQYAYSVGMQIRRK